MVSGEVRRIEVCYDWYRDVLLGLLRPEPAVAAEPVAVDLFILHDAASGARVGFECLEFSERGCDEQWLRTLPEIRGLLVPLDRPGDRPTLSAILGRLWATAKAGGSFDRKGEPAPESGQEEHLLDLALG